MAAKKSWIQAALAAIAVAAGLLVVVVVGIVQFANMNATTLHPDPQKVPSVTEWSPSPKWTAAVEQGRQLARSRLAEQNLPGLSVAVGVGGDGVGGEIVWAEGFGWADLENKVPVAPRMRFRIGHASKALTSAAVGLLREKGRLNIDDEIQTYVPAFPRKQWSVTLRQLMGHVAGVRHYNDESDYTISAHCERASEGLPSFVDDPLLFEPETRYAYSTFGWILVSAAVEAAADEPFFSFMRTQIFKPLGMADTTSESATEPITNRVIFYERDFTGRELPATVNYSCFAGAGGFLSTPSDLVRFGMAVSSRLRQGYGGQAGAQDGTLLQPATVKMLQTPQRLASGEETAYGLGWMLETVPLAGEPTRMAGHASRTLTGGSTSFLTFPERGIVVAVTTNFSFADTRSIALGIAEAFAEQAKRPAR